MPGEPRDPQPHDEFSRMERPDIGERLLRYFRDNPAAMDSVEGIARFWVHEEKSVVERALKDLHARGLLARRVIAATEFYSVPREAAVPAAPVSREAPGPRPAFRTENPGRILVVEDDPGVRSLLLDVLAGAGHQVTEAEQGDRGLALLQPGRFDLVITDVLMPGLSGLQVMEAARSADPATQVIVVTGHPSLDLALEALRLGAYDLVAKPIADLESFHRVVERALDRNRMSIESRLLVANLQARNRELSETVGRLALVNEIGRATTALFGLRAICDELTRLVAQHFKARRVSVLMAEPDADTMTIVASVGIVEPEALQRRVRVGEGLAGRVALTEIPLLVSDIDKSDLRLLRAGGRYSTPSFMITPLTVTYPIRFQRRRLGVINVSDKRSGEPFDERDLEFLSTLTAQVAMVMENARLVEEMERGYLGLVVGLIQAAEDATPRRRGHSRRVIETATAVGRAMGLEGARLEVLRRAAALHEVGRLLRPAGPARAAAAGRARPVRGAAGRARPRDGWQAEAAVDAERALSPIASLLAAREVILHSADRLEAASLPAATDQASLSVESGILAACEEYVERTGGRAAGRARDALREIERHAGTRHDPDVIAALGRVVESEDGTAQSG